MLEANQSFPLQLSRRPEENVYFENVELLSPAENEEESYFVFQGQCMVLGDSRVGKTSLVKSLTGKKFDPNQTKTQGIDLSLVDKKWKYYNMKELIFGDLWRFFTWGTVQVQFIRTGEATSTVVGEEFVLWKMFFPLLVLSWTLQVVYILVMLVMGDNHWLAAGSWLLYSMNYVPEIALFCSYHFTCDQIRFTLATLSFIIRRRGLLIGSYLAPIVCYWGQPYYDLLAVRSKLLFLATTSAVIIFVALFIVIGPSVNEYQRSIHLYTGRLIQNQLSLSFLCFTRLLLSVSIGFICGFVAASLIDESFFKAVKTASEEGTDRPFRPFYGLVDLLVFHFVWNFPNSIFYEFSLWLPRDRKPLPNHVLDNWDICGLISVSVTLVFYHYKLALTSANLYFVILFPSSICYTLYVELLYLRSTVPGNFKTPNKLITSVTGKALWINKKTLRSALDEKFSSLKLKILDFAGDKEYYAYHHMFLRGHAIYLIVFNMTEFVVNDFKEINVGMQRLKFWIESVCSHVPSKAPIFLIGTHKETVDKKGIEIIDCQVRRNLWNSYCDELIMNDVEGLVFFPVENSHGRSDFGIQCLQKKIVDVAEHCKETIGRDIPLPWVRIQDAIISHTEKKGAKFCVTLDEFPRAFENVVCTDWSKDALKYFHEKGLVIYLERSQSSVLSNWVLLKPEILVDIIIQLVIPPPEITQERGLRHDWNLLQKKGLLTKSLLKNILSKVKENEEAMTAFLEEYDLICPLANRKVKMCRVHEDEEQPTHFVPSLLPMASERDTPIWYDDDTDKKCFVFFTKFLPEPLFHHLLSRAHKLSRVEYPKGHTFLFRDAGKFWLSPQQPYSLKLMREEKMIEVTFSCR